MRHRVFAVALMLAGSLRAAEPPVILWASDPVAPGEMVVAGALLLSRGAVAADAPVIAPALQPFVDSQRLAGAVVLLADRDRVFTTEAVGFADRAAARPMRPDTLFWIASQTKAVTAAAVMMLVDEGKVALGDPVAKYIPEFAQLQVGPRDAKDATPLHAPARAITVRDVLCHISGMRFLNSKDRSVIDSVSLEQSVRNDLLEPLLFEPGTRYQYSNEGIDTAGLIVQRVSGLPFERFLQERLFTPLGMRDTSFFLTTEGVGRLARSYRPNKDKTALEETRITYLKYPLDGPDRHPSPGGGLFSTAADVARFCQMLLRRGELDGRRYLSEAAVAEMTRKQTGDALKESYGLGLGVGPTSFGHGGAYATNMQVDTRRGLITVFLVQHAGWLGDVREMHTALAKANEQVIARATAPPR